MARACPLNVPFIFFSRLRVFRSVRNTGRPVQTSTSRDKLTSKLRSVADLEDSKFVDRNPDMFNKWKKQCKARAKAKEMADAPGRTRAEKAVYFSVESEHQRSSAVLDGTDDGAEAAKYVRDEVRTLRTRPLAGEALTGVWLLRECSAFHPCLPWLTALAPTRSRRTCAPRRARLTRPPACPAYPHPALPVARRL